MRQHIWSVAEIDDLLSLRKQHKSWKQIARSLNNKYGMDTNANAVRMKYRDVRDKYPAFEEHKEAYMLRNRGRLRRNNNKKTREVNLITKHMDQHDELITRIKLACRRMSRSKVEVSRQKNLKGEKFTLEPLLSDLHIGKAARDFSREVLQRRLQQYTDRLLRFCELHQIERIVPGLMGDLIENQTMHGIHSVRACEFSTSMQIQYAIEDIWAFFILPLAKTGIKMDCKCVTGNHDRDISSREYHYPGKHNFTFIIYNSLKFMAEAVGFTHVTFDIPDVAYCTTEIYGRKVLFEHFDVLKSCSPDVAERLIQKRSAQLETLIDYIRGGHFHTHHTMFAGRVVFNGGLASGEGYADTKGYKSVPGQSVSIYSSKEGYITTYFVRCD